MNTITLCAVAVLCGVALAQTPDEPIRSTSPNSPSARAAPASPLSASDLLNDPAIWRAPIHTLQGDPDYGWWAGSRTYKVSFRDGFAFYPFLGAAYPEHLPLRWTTERITAGGEPIAEPRDAAPSHTDWRYEYRYGSVTEAYDVRDDGVEQTFVLYQRPKRSGDLVISGRIDTKLRCAQAAAAHPSLTFADGDGKPIVRYGEAFAFDAEGRRTEVTTSFDEGRIRLTVPAAWLEEAVYPVVVDPLTSPALIGNGTSPSAGFVDVAHDAESHEVLVVFSFQIVGGDYDTLGVLVTNNLGGRVTIFRDFEVYATTYNQCCFVGGADKWVIATGRRHPNNVGTIALYTHQRAIYTANSGFVRSVNRDIPGPTLVDQYPSIGGSFQAASGTRAFVVWKRDGGAVDTATSAIWGTVIDVLSTANIPFTAQFEVDAPGTNFDQEWPCVNKCSTSGDWLVVYQEFDNRVSTDDWDIDCAVVLQTGSVFQRFRLGNDASPDHKIMPKIEGNSGRYFYAFTQKPIDGKNTTIMGDRITAEQFDWTGTLSRRSGLRNLESPGTGAWTTGAGNRGIAYDRLSVSHAAVAYESLSSVFVQRIGFNAIPVERVSVPSAHSGALVFNPDFVTFTTAWSSNGTPWNVSAANFGYQAARCDPYGTGCGGVMSCANASLPANAAGPHRGSSEFFLLLRNATPSAVCLPVLGAGSANIPLPGFCTLLLDPLLPIFVLPAAVTNAQGAVDYKLPIPESVIADVFMQWATAAPTLKTSNAVKLQIR